MQTTNLKKTPAYLFSIILTSLTLLSTVDDVSAQSGVPVNPCDRIAKQGDKFVNAGELVHVETPTGLHSIKRIFFSNNGSIHLATVRSLTEIRTVLGDGTVLVEGKAPVNVWKLEPAGRQCKSTFVKGLEVVIGELSTDYFPVGIARTAYVREGVASLLFTIPK